MAVNEQFLKAEITKACTLNGVESYILLFVDGNKMKSIADISMTEMAPLLMQAMMSKKK
jgi:hypothetical protein